MNQLGIKLPEAEMKFLEWYAKEFSTPKAALYRDKTLNTFRKWKIEFLLDLFVQGNIGFKKFCNLGNISLIEGMNILEESNLEPKLPELLDDYTTEITNKNITEKDHSIFKNGKPIYRSSPEVTEDE